MPRPKLKRKVNTPPKCLGFKPFGYYALEKEPILLHVEELESIKLCDYENFSQAQAAETMQISRPTFTRIYENARKKIAQSFAEARPVLFEGGQYFFEDLWYQCNDCNSVFNIPAHSKKIFCPLCSSTNIEKKNNEE